MSINEIYKYFKKEIYENAADEKEEEKMLEKLEEIDDLLRELEKDIERNEEISREHKEYLDCEQMNADFVYSNCLPTFEYSVDDYRR